LTTSIPAVDLVFIPPITNPILKGQSLDYIPVGLLVLLASLSQHGYKASIYKPQFRILVDQDINKVCKDILLSHPKSIGFSTWCHSYPLSILLARELKKINPETPIIFGGPQSTALAGETLERYPFVDYIIRGEADYCLIKLLDIILSKKNNFTLADVEGLTYRNPQNDQKISNNFPAGFINNLDDLPIPQYEKIYNKLSLLIETGRGCPYHCTYCSTSQFFQKSYRTKSVERIINEIDYCYIRLKSRLFGFSHDMITLDKKFINNLCYALKQYFNEKKKKFGWTCSARTDCLSTEMLKVMAASGCQGIFFGIETGSERMQEKIKKNLNLADAVRKVKYSVSQGINSVVSYMAGFPDESREDLNKTLNSIILMSLSGAIPQMTLLSLLPGTPLYKQKVSELKYDGKNSGFVDTIVPDPVIDIVQEDKEIFSSYYYLENSAIRRESYLFISSIVNLLSSFIPTLVLLRDRIIKDIRRINILDYVEKKMPDYLSIDSISEPGLFFLMDSIQKYLFFLKNKKLHVVHWEIFQANFIRASVLIMYNNWQVYRVPGTGGTKRISQKNYQDTIKVLPVWKMFESNYNICNYINFPSIHTNDKIPRKGHYSFVVIPISDRETEIFNIPRKFIRIIKNLKDTSVAEFISNAKPDLEEKDSMYLLRRLIKLNMVEVLHQKIMDL
jgi:radical SAM superfamily enzyme YgiQ (UPF0313 family)